MFFSLQCFDALNDARFVERSKINQHFSHLNRAFLRLYVQHICVVLIALKLQTTREEKGIIKIDDDIKMMRWIVQCTLDTDDDDDDKKKRNPWCPGHRPD